MRKTVVLYPGLAVSHFVPMMQFADVLLDHGYDVAVALIDPALKEDIALPAVVARVAASKPSVSFHTLPRVRDPPAITHDARFLLGYLELVRRHNQHLHDLLCSMDPRRVHAVVVDTMSVEALGVARKLGIPGYSFFPSNAGALAVFVQLPSIRVEGQPSFKEMGNAPLEFIGLPSTPASYLDDIMLEEDPESEVYNAAMATMRRIVQADGILVNTFETLEPRAVGALRSAMILPGRVLPPVYCVGPFVDAAGGGDERHECLAWLDQQPDRSVVYLCFGSVGACNHSKEQLGEIAAGLENSGHRFLWVVRAPLSDDPRADPDLDALLPAGFLQRTADCGLVVKLWAPQADVLRHRATGAFVTHCGWNSVLEGVTAGVPMLGWPLYAEQRINMVLMVEEMKVAVEMVGWQRGLVTAGEVEAKVRLVMESEEGRELRARVAAHKEGAAVAWKDGGSSRATFPRFLSDAERLGLAVEKCSTGGVGLGLPVGECSAGGV